MNDTEQFDITPSTDIIRPIREDSRMNTPTALSELIDNALDAGATDVEIEVTSSSITIRDNGKGCANLQPMLQLGNYNPDGRRIGRYGVGFNHAAIWLGLEVHITTVCEKVMRRVSVNWDAIQDWKVSVPPVTSVEADPYMEIVISPLVTRKRPNAASIISSLILRYPLLEKSDKRISVNNTLIPTVDLPDLTSVIRIADEYEGMAYRLIAGIRLEQSKVFKDGVTVMLRDRVMETGSTEGCGEYSPYNFFALVELLEGVELEDGSTSQSWPVDKVKTGLTDTIKLFLTTLEPVFEPILKAAEETTMDITLHGFEEKLSGEWLNEALVGVKERRPGRPGNEGTADPANTGRQRLSATNVDMSRDGNVEKLKPIGKKINVTFGSLDDRRISNVFHNQKVTNCVLNADHPFIQECRANKDPRPLRVFVAQTVLSYWLDNYDLKQRIVTQLALDLDGPRYEQMDQAMARVLTYLRENDIFAKEVGGKAA